MITDELRKWADDALMRLSAHKDLLEIADRIDAEHYAALSSKAVNAVLYGTEFVTMPASELAEHYIELPKDADGEYIHIGDVMDELDARCLGTPTTFTVADMFYQGNDRWHLRAYPATYDPKTCRHHHAPTVEDVLREFGRGWHERMVGPETFDIADYVEQYAAKLRLAGDGE